MRPTQKKETRRTADRLVRNTQLGIVSKVFAHTDEDDYFNHEANVILTHNEEELRRLPIHVTQRGEAVVPEVGEMVTIDFLSNNTQSAYISGYAYNNEDRPPLARPGHWRQRFGPEDGPYLFFEAEPADHSAGTPDIVRMGKKPDGLSDPTTTVEIDDSGSSTEVSIETDGDITLKADGDIVVDNGGTPKSVLTEDAVFEYEDTTIEDTDDGSGSETTTTKETTTVVNDEVTSTEID